MKPFFLVLFMVLGFGRLGAQGLDRATVKSLVQGKSFVFKAQTVVPMGAQTRQLNTSEYDLRISGDSIVAYLPYFGRAYSAPTPGEIGGINFTTTGFQYATKEKKQGRWDVSIEPANTKDVRSMTLSIFENGYASLQVISLNRQPISFNGYIQPLHK